MTIIIKLIHTCGLLAVLSDEEPGTCNPLEPLDLNDLPDGTRTPPTPTPPASPLPMSIRAVAQLRPVSIPASICDMAGKI